MLSHSTPLQSSIVSYTVDAIDAKGRPCQVTFDGCDPHEVINPCEDECMVFFDHPLDAHLTGVWFWHNCGHYTRIEPGDIHSYYDIDDMCTDRESRFVIRLENRRLDRLIRAGEDGRMSWYQVVSEWKFGVIDCDLALWELDKQRYSRQMMTRPGPKTGAVPAQKIVRRLSAKL